MGIKFEKTIDKPVIDIHGNETDTRFVRLESPDADYKVCISFHKCGYIDIFAHRDKKGAAQCGETAYAPPEVFIHCDADGAPAYAEAAISSQRMKAEDFEDFTLFLERVHQNVAAINEVIKQVNAGERYL